MKKNIGIYLHIPFCASKCPYCDFYSVPAKEDAMDTYLSALLRAIDRFPVRDVSADTVYFGGGTPILFGSHRLSAVLSALDRACPIDKDAEITLEANPHHSTDSELRSLRLLGINRLSLGIQSANDGELSLLGRTHRTEESLRCIDSARRAGFDNLSLDLMIGLPGQSASSLAHSLDVLISCRPEHLSTYLLKIEPGTPFAKRYRAEDLDEDQQASLYLQTVATLTGNGYSQYEISNFSLPGKESRHNLKYWEGKEYLGIGPAAHSFFAPTRTAFPRDLSAFCGAPDPWSLLEETGTGGDVEEWIMLHLRLARGVVWTELAAAFPDFDSAILLRRAEPLRKQGFFTDDPDRLALTPKGMLVSNQIIGLLLA